MNGIPLPSGGKGNELHMTTTTTCRINQQTRAEQFASTNSLQSLKDFGSPYLFTSCALLLNSKLYRTTTTVIVNSTTAASCNDAISDFRLVALTCQLFSLIRRPQAPPRDTPISLLSRPRSKEEPDRRRSYCSYSRCPLIHATLNAPKTVCSTASTA